MSNGDVVSFENLILKNKNINNHPQLAEDLNDYLAVIAVDGNLPPEEIIDAIYELAPTDEDAQAILDELIEQLQADGLSLAIVSDAGEQTATITVDENTVDVTTVVAVDPQADEVVYSIAGGADAALFDIDAQTGELVFVGAPDYEAPADSDGDNTYDVIVQATDTASGQTDTQAISVVVADVYEAPPSFGTVFTGIDAYNYSGHWVSSAGDLNGDGIDDFVISSRPTTSSLQSLPGEGYVIFGVEGGFDPVVSLASLDGTNGFTFIGLEASDRRQIRVSEAGDVNGDGIADLIIGNASATVDGNALVGESYVIFGTTDGFDPVIDVTQLNGTNGFALSGVATGDQSGMSVSSAGDVNGDGVDDLLIGAWLADPGGNESGEAYVVFGGDAGVPPALDLSTLDGTNGFAILGVDAGDRTGWSVADAGDINGDGIDDIAVGAYQADPNGQSNAGEAYVIFGTDSTFSATFDLSTLNGSNGFVVEGTISGGLAGFSVSGAGDVNGDGIEDLIIGAPRTDPLERLGEAYVIFGSDAGFDASFDLDALDGTNGFQITGLEQWADGGFATSAGDLNGDGIADILIGAPSLAPDGEYRGGGAHVVFGTAGGFSPSVDLASLDGSDGYVFKGNDAYDYTGYSISSAGDVNGDGIDDILIGGLAGDPNSNTEAGETYLIYGGAENLAAFDAADGTADGVIDLGLIVPEEFAF